MWTAFIVGMIIGAAAGLFIAGLCMAAGDADRQAERAHAKGVEADDVYCTLDSAGAWDFEARR